jgi:hypothetical protein
MAKRTGAKAKSGAARKSDVKKPTSARAGKTKASRAGRGASGRTAGQRGASSERGVAARGMRSADAVLLVILVPGGRSIEEPVEALLDFEVPATGIETRGLADLIKHEIPIFGGVSERLPDLPHGRLLLSITTRERAMRVLRELEPLSRGNNAVRAAVLDVSAALGV